MTPSSRTPNRHIYVEPSLLFIAGLVLAVSFHSQYVLGMQPFPLCLLQRVWVGMIFFISFVAMGCSSKRTLKITLILRVVIAGIGLFFAARQLWLLHIPPDATCIPNASALVAYVPWQTIAKALLWGDGICVGSVWFVFGTSMPEWSALYFLFMMVTCGYFYLEVK